MLAACCVEIVAIPEDALVLCCTLLSEAYLGISRDSVFGRNPKPTWAGAWLAGSGKSAWHVDIGRAMTFLKLVQVLACNDLPLYVWFTLVQVNVQFMS